jgi:c-di-GMP-binding flagellar brake protein YcgR
VATHEISLQQKCRIEEILRILDENPVPSSAENRRNAKRVNVRLTLSIYLLSVPGHPPLDVHTRNISTSGVGMVSRRPFRKGERIAIELYKVSKLEKLILAEATFSRYVRDGLYEVGCLFKEAISRDEARGFERIPQRWIMNALHPHQQNQNQNQNQN